MNRYLLLARPPKLMDVSPLQSYVARLKDEKAALERVLKQLDVSEDRIDDTDEWIEQVTVRLGAIDTALKALDEV